MKEVETMKW